jgi:hypothetical protein
VSTKPKTTRRERRRARKVARRAPAVVSTALSTAAGTLAGAATTAVASGKPAKVRLRRTRSAARTVARSRTTGVILVLAGGGVAAWQFMGEDRRQQVLGRLGLAGAQPATPEPDLSTERRLTPLDTLHDGPLDPSGATAEADTYGHGEGQGQAQTERHDG